MGAKTTKPNLRGRKQRFNIRTITDLSRLIKVCEDDLLMLATKLTEHGQRSLLYRSWEQPKKTSGTRPIDEPTPKLKWVQQRINALILQRLQVHPTAVGGIRRRSLIHNVRPHVGKPMVAKFDLKDFFPSIASGRVYDLFCSTGCSPDVAHLLTRLTTFKGRVPQGAPTSTMIAVLVAGYGGTRSFNGRLAILARKHGSDCSTWIDDVTVSGPRYLPRLAPTVQRIARQCGFTTNQKSQFLGRDQQQMVTGLVVNEKPNVPRTARRALRAVLHKCKTQGPQALPEKSVLELKPYLRGKIAHIQGVNPEQGARFLTQFNAINWASSAQHSVAPRP